MKQSGEVREALEQKRQSLEETVKRIQAEESSETASDQADAAQEWENAEIREGELTAARQELVEVEAALARLDRGEYGVCERCGSPIGAERLALLPAAVLCASCATGG